MKYGNGDFVYELVEAWGNVPKEWTLNIIPGVSVDSKDRIYILSRGKPPVVVLDKEGNYLEHWGEDVFVRAHGIYISPQDVVYCVDDAGHVVYKFNNERELIMTLGEKGKPSDSGCIGKDYKTVKRGAPPFNRPTNLALSKNNDIYVTDGYGNARVHKFKYDGTLEFSWGEPGDQQGNFNLPHGIEISSEDIVYVADRQNNRIQLFTLEGQFIEEWKDLIRPTDLFIDNNNTLYVSEAKRTSVFDNSPSRVSIFDLKGNLLARLENETTHYSPELGHRTAHGICVDSEGSIYLCEVGKKISENYFALKKYQRV